MHPLQEHALAVSTFHRLLPRCHHSVSLLSGLGRVGLCVGDIAFAQRCFALAETAGSEDGGIRPTQMLVNDGLVALSNGPCACVCVCLFLTFVSPKMRQTPPPPTHIPAKPASHTDIHTRAHAGHFADAAATFGSARAQDPSNIAAANNEAVCKLYSGTLSPVREAQKLHLNAPPFIISQCIDWSHRIL